MRNRDLPNVPTPESAGNRLYTIVYEHVCVYLYTLYCTLYSDAEV